MLTLKLMLNYHCYTYTLVIRVTINYENLDNRQ